MNQADLQIIINGFDASTEKEGAFFGIYQYGKTADESYIKANKNGLELFAAELLKAAKDADNVVANSTQPRIIVDYSQEWFDVKADTFIQYIEIIDDSIQREKQPSAYKLSVKDKLIPAFFVIAGIIILFLLIVGVYATFKWLF